MRLVRVREPGIIVAGHEVVLYLSDHQAFEGKVTQVSRNGWMLWLTFTVEPITALIEKINHEKVVLTWRPEHGCYQVYRQPYKSTVRLMLKQPSRKEAQRHASP